MSSRRVAGALLVALLACARPGAAQQPQVVSTPPDYPRGRISGLAFGDVYYNLDGDPDHGYNSGG
ncbi:MAG: hypothetical protein ACHQ52_06180, partial [Candidatus Eisenbacteria bacterium]